MFERIKGQKVAIRMLGNEIQRGRLPSSIMFYGPDGCGKFLTAMELARVLNCSRGIIGSNFGEEVRVSHEGACRNTGQPPQDDSIPNHPNTCTCISCVNISKLISRNLFLICRSNLRNSFDLWRQFGVNHENLQWFQRDLRRLLLTIYDEPRYVKDCNELEGFLHTSSEIPAHSQKIIRCVFGILDSLKGMNISIEKIRQIQRFLWVKGSDGGFKVVIIDGAENMNEESSNSFLKISEDTPPDSLIILCTANRDAIRETILSRFRMYRFFALSGDARNEVLKERFGETGKRTEDQRFSEAEAFAQRLEDESIRLLDFLEIVKEILDCDQVISFLDFTIHSSMEKFTLAGNLSMEDVYRIEALIKTAASVRNAILYGNANIEIVFTSFMLNNYRSSIR